MWNETICDGGQAALAFTRGSSSSEAISDPVIFASMLLTPETVAANLSEQKKEHYRTMPRVIIGAPLRRGVPEGVSRGVDGSSVQPEAATIRTRSGEPSSAARKATEPLWPRTFHTEPLGGLAQKWTSRFRLLAPPSRAAAARL